MWQVASATGWSVGYILHGVNYQTLIMMLSDAPRYRRVQTKVTGASGHIEGNAAPEPIDADVASAEAEELLGFFQSQLK